MFTVIKLQKRADCQSQNHPAGSDT